MFEIIMNFVVHVAQIAGLGLVAYGGLLVAWAMLGDRSQQAGSVSRERSTFKGNEPTVRAA